MPTSTKLYGTRLRRWRDRHRDRADRGVRAGLFYAPIEADQGFSQKIFYVHVPLAIVTLGGFVFGGICAIQYLRSGDPRYDLRSYTAIHQSLIFCVGALLTGVDLGEGPWGHWWVWDEPTLVSFLIVFLLYATYQPLRFSIEDPEKQSRYAGGVRDRRRRVRAAELHGRAARRRRSIHPRVLRTRPAATCPATCASPSTSR